MLSCIAHELENITHIQAYKDVLGSRAKYLFDFDEEKHTETYYITLFEEGKTEEREKAYTFLLNNNPKVLKELIKKVYKKEKADLRKYWIHSDEIDLFDGTDEVWILEQLKNEKNHDVKIEWIWKLGSVFPDGSVHQSFEIAQKWISTLDKYIQFETTKKGLKAKITLPEKQDFQYFEEMSTWKGIHGEKAGVLIFLLSCKPVYTWQYSIDELAKALKGNEYEQVFWDGLILSCYRYDETPQKWIDEIYNKGKYYYWQPLLTPLVSTELCIEIAFKTTTIFANFAQSLLERKNITHEHLLYVLELLAKQSYRNYSLGSYAQHYVSLFVRNVKEEHIQEYIDKLSKCSNNTEIVTQLTNALENLQSMYTALS